MTRQKANKGPKFEPSTTAKAPFEIEIPERVRALILSEQKIANNAIETYVRERTAHMQATANQILRGWLAVETGVPTDIALQPNDDFTKLIEQ